MILRKHKRKLSDRAIIAEADAAAERLLAAVEEKDKAYKRIKKGYEQLRARTPESDLLDMIIFEKEIPRYTDRFNDRYKAGIKDNVNDPFEDRYRRADEIHLTDILRASAGLEVYK